jgi:hypothetical protein
VLSVQEVEAAIANGQPIPQPDTVYANVTFPLVQTFYPLGFPVEISTNSQAILVMATESWGAFHCAFSIPPIRIQVGVVKGKGSACPPATTCRVQKHLFSFVADQENFGIIDLQESFASVWLSDHAIQYRKYIRYHFLDCAAICQIATRYATGIHAACVVRNGIGVLLCGDSGAGKSTLSYACAKAGWTYVTDDSSYLVHGQEELLVTGNCHQVRFRPATGSIYPEINGREIVQRTEIGKPSIELVPSVQGLRCSQTARASYLVFLNRREGINAPLRPFSREIARAFLRQARFSPPGILVTQYAAIDRLLDTEVLELRYTDLAWALARLAELVDSGRS